jgi:hypothetical protein
MSEHAESSTNGGLKLKAPHEAPGGRVLKYEGEARGLRFLHPEMLIAQLARFAGRDAIYASNYVVNLPRAKNFIWRKGYEIHNSEVGRDNLLDKYRFTELVREMGYSAPASVLVPTGATAESILSRVRKLDDTEQRRFCKPREGSKGRGAALMETHEKAVEFVLNENKEYLIQSPEVPVQDWRYIFIEMLTN